MDITPLVKEDSMIIQGYGPGAIRIGGQSYNQPVLVLSDQVLLWDYKKSANDLVLADCDILKEHSDNIDVVLFGGGEGMPSIDALRRQEFRENGIGLEPMDTGAACRTFNVLLAEGRRVAALLIPSSSL